ncbi:hypothetical protein D3C71_2030450 [compost metagenome]
MRFVADTFKANNGIFRTDAQHHVGVIDGPIMAVRSLEPDNLVAGVSFKFAAYLRRTA